jgi:hypothetical protein
MNLKTQKFEYNQTITPLFLRKCAIIFTSFDTQLNSKHSYEYTFCLSIPFPY